MKKKFKTNRNIKRGKTYRRLINVMLFQTRCLCVAGSNLGCVADLIYPRLVINVCKAVPISLFWAKKELNAFRIPFQLHWQLTMAFLTGHSWLL